MCGVKLSAWAKSVGVTYHTAYKWFRDGTMPVPAYQTETGTILVDVPVPAGGGLVVLYARVSSAGQSSSLDTQVAQVTEWATKQGVSVDRVVREVGSALNGSRRKFQRVLSDPSVGTVLVQRRDRVCRFGFDYLQAALAAHGRQVLVMDDSEIDDDLVPDMTEVLTSLCARVHGKRGARKRAQVALAAAEASSGEGGSS